MDYSSADHYRAAGLRLLLPTGEGEGGSYNKAEPNIQVVFLDGLAISEYRLSCVVRRVGSRDGC